MDNLISTLIQSTELGLQLNVNPVPDYSKYQYKETALFIKTKNKKITETTNFIEETNIQNDQQNQDGGFPPIYIAGGAVTPSGYNYSRGGSFNPSGYPGGGNINPSTGGAPPLYFGKGMTGKGPLYFGIGSGKKHKKSYSGCGSGSSEPGIPSHTMESIRNPNESNTYGHDPAYRLRNAKDDPRIVY